LTSDISWLRQILSWCQDDQPDATPTLDFIAKGLHKAGDDDIETLCETLLANLVPGPAQAKRLRSLLQIVASQFVTRQSRENRQSDESNPAIAIEALSQLYHRWLPVDPTCAALSLQCLAAQSDEEAIAATAELISQHPLADWQLVGLGLSPLWKCDGQLLAFFFERLDSQVFHPLTLSVLLDLANHGMRSSRLEHHPWSTQCDQLAALLKQVVIRLEKLQRDPSQFGHDVKQVQQILNDAVALTISLCDTLGQIGWPAAIPALHEALELAHRRIQCEAAASLAGMNDPRGLQRLVELALDPVARVRAVNYAEELGVADQIDQQYRSPLALAESELAGWLASPEQFGLPPTQIQSLETRTLYWPGYEEPRDCYLFRFEYDLPQGSTCNIGIAGPVTLAFATNLNHFPLEDVYAAFAGWQLEHEEIYELPIGQLAGQQSRWVELMIDSMRDAGYEEIAPLLLTFLLGEPALLTQARLGSSRGIAIAQESDISFFPTNSQPDSMTPAVALSIFRGRKLLQAFNGSL
jgi:hypothetical protein